MSPLSIMEPKSISHNVSKLRRGVENSSRSLANCAMPSAMNPKLSTRNRITKCLRVCDAEESECPKKCSLHAVKEERARTRERKKEEQKERARERKREGEREREIKGESARERETEKISKREGE